MFLVGLARFVGFEVVGFFDGCWLLRVLDYVMLCDVFGVVS